MISRFHPVPGKKISLGNMHDRVCRFCGKRRPEVTFKKVAHAIPELLGNKSLVTAYECDTCNCFFGRTIENDLGNWSKPMRTFARIRNKENRVPILKQGSSGGWRIWYGDARLNIRHNPDNPIAKIDQAAGTITFSLMRDPYTPVAVLKAFVKIGLTLLPETEIAPFASALDWIMEPDHSLSPIRSLPIGYTFTPGPMTSDRVFAAILRRRVGVTGVPYAFLVLIYGNETFQVWLPASEADADIEGRPMTFPNFPAPASPDPATYGTPGFCMLDMTGVTLVKGERVPVGMGFDKASVTVPVAEAPGASTM